jgi:hypothetical protein
MHVDGFVRGKGQFVVTDYVPTDEAHRPALPAAAHHRAHPLSQYNVGAQTRRTGNVVWHEEDVLEIHPTDAENRGLRDGDWVAPCEPHGRNHPARFGDGPGGARRGLHHLPPSGDAGQCRHHRIFGLGDQLPGIQGHGGAGEKQSALARRIEVASMDQRANQIARNLAAQGTRPSP